MLNFIYELAIGKRKGIIYIIPKIILLFLALIYGILIRLLMLLAGFSRKKFNCRIISVGNITLGGSGKTPLVEYISQFLLSQGYKPAIISRGYKGTDEPDMLQKKLPIPVIINPDRLSAINQAIKDYAVNAIVLDDGFQQWKIIKDLEIVALDSQKPFGNNCMIPAGILRQPVSTSKKADIFVLTKSDHSAGMGKTRELLKQINPQAVIAECVHAADKLYELEDNSRDLELQAMKNKKVVLLSAIADPQSFKHSALALSCEIAQEAIFPDHYRYTQNDLNKVFRIAEGKKAEYILTTEKDAVKLKHLAKQSSVKIIVLAISIKFTQNEQGFLDRLHKLHSL